MMKIFGSRQIREIDAYTIQNEPVSSVDLMERAAGRVFAWIVSKYSRSCNFVIFTGPGNNGGDGLVIARMLHLNDYCVEVFTLSESSRTADWEINFRRFNDSNGTITEINGPADIPVIKPGIIIVDAIFGSGLNRPVSGIAADVIQSLNVSGATVISVDIPSGLFCDDNSENDFRNIVRADHTLTFQFPKLSFMFSGNSEYAGEWHVLDIGLHRESIKNTDTDFYYVTGSNVSGLIKRRLKFDHKGVYGHGLLIAGSYGKIGAAVLSARSALRTGIGLLTCVVPECGYDILQTSVNEAMVVTSSSEKIISDIPDPGGYDAIGVGPGIGTDIRTADAFRKLITTCTLPLVIDADGINILASDTSMLQALPKLTILTPHPGEFDRLAGRSENDYERLMKQITLSRQYDIIIVLKGAQTSISLPSGKVYFNSTGNPGMATAGSGDVLAGMILSFLAQGYTQADAALLAVYLHGLSGDIAASEKSEESLIASDIINYTGNAFMKLRSINDHQDIKTIK